MKPALYLEALAAESDHDDDNVLVSLETLIVLNVLSFVENASGVEIFLITSTNAATSKSFLRIPKRSINARFQTEASFATNIASKMTFPIMKVDEWLYVAGLCSVCRSIIKNAGQCYEYLLGFKQSCLSAPAEVSPWTRFCEIDVIQCARIIRSFHDNLREGQTRFDVPNALACFESHLHQAPRQHNKNGRPGRQKVKSAEAMEHIENQLATIALNSTDSSTTSGSDNIATAQNTNVLIQPRFMEGDTISIADLVVYPSIWIMITTMQKYNSMQIESLLPLSCAWLECVRCSYQSDNLLCFLKTSVEPKPITESTVEYALNAVSDFSLYKREPKGQRAKSRKFTKQHELDQAIRKIDAMKICTTATSTHRAYKGNVVHSRAWTNLPAYVLPEPEQIPESRLDRKREQLFCLAKEVAELSTPGDVIVDFCSGAGHLGILIAHQLSECLVILLENKEESAMRAKERIECIGLHWRNIVVFQCNIDYLCGQFDIGTSLHACGVATDIVIMQCIKRQANFVSCPCCYGSCIETSDISYPRSKLYRAHGISTDDYKYLSHAADQAHDLDKTQNADKSLQGMACMDYVDTDRKLYAEECGYNVQLTLLHPENCTPKNRLLIGTFDRQSI